MGDGGVENFQGRVFAEKLVTDGLNKVGFAETGTSIEEKWIITGTWTVNDATCG